MFLTQPREDDEALFIIKPMNCPGHIQIFKNGLKSYRDLPSARRIRQGASLRAVGCAARAAARARLHPGRRAYLITEEQIAEGVAQGQNQICRSTRISAFPT